jgi:acetylornithine deacetylase/succinyl-diaminopimelate desuccinylase-like protein
MEVAASWLSGRGMAVAIHARVPDRPNLVLEFGASQGPVLTLNGHLDTVPVSAGEQWDFDPFGGRVHAGCLYGRGALDMKGACAVMMHVAEILHRHQGDLRGRLQLQLVSDEEQSGYFGTGYLLERVDAGALARPASVLIGEKSDLRIRVAERGHFQFHVVFRGRAAHTATARVLGVNPIVHAAAATLRLDRPLDKFHPAVGHPIISVNRIEAGQATNQVPAECTLTIDRRLTPGETKESVIADVVAVLETLRREIPSLDYRLVPVKTPDGRDEYSAPSMTALDHPLVAQVQDAYRSVLGQAGEIFVDWAGGTDARLFRACGIPTVVLGASGSGFHGANEHVRVDSLVTLARIYLGVAARLIGPDAG